MKETAIFHQEKKFRRFLICRSEYFTSAMKEVLNDPDGHLNKTNLPFFKNAPGDTTTVAVVMIADKKFVIKRYNRKGFWHGMKSLFRMSRAWRCWKNSQYLEQHGIPTAKSVAVLIERYGPIQGKAYFIMEYVEGLRGLDIFKKNSKYQASWGKMLENLSELLKKLHAARVTHDDFQHNNIVFVNEVPVLLDLDYTRIHRYKSLWFRTNFIKDVKNFLRVLDEINPGARHIAENILCKYYGR